MTDKIQDTDVREAVDEIKEQHPTLQERLERYRERRNSYDAKHLRRVDTAAAPARQGATRTLRG